MPTVAQALSEATSALAAAGVATPDFDARALLAEILTAGHIAQLVTRRQSVLVPDQASRYQGLLARRARREPLQYILGYTEFYGLRLKCDRRALIPRPDTETLVDVVLSALPDGAACPAHLCDIGTGTGAIAIALAANRADLKVWATDASEETLSLSRENVAFHRLEDRIALLEGEGLEPLREAGVLERITALVSNPPYVAEHEYESLAPEITQHEPRLALVGGDTDGLGFYRAMAGELAELPALRLVAAEVGYDQAEQVARLIGDALPQWRLSVHFDLGGVARVVLAEALRA